MRMDTVFPITTADRQCDRVHIARGEPVRAWAIATASARIRPFARRTDQAP